MIKKSEEVAISQKMSQGNPNKTKAHFPIKFRHTSRSIQNDIISHVKWDRDGLLSENHSWLFKIF